MQHVDARAPTSPRLVPRWYVRPSASMGKLASRMSLLRGCSTVAGLPAAAAAAAPPPPAAEAAAAMGRSLHSKAQRMFMKITRTGRRQGSTAEEGRNRRGGQKSETAGSGGTGGGAPALDPEALTGLSAAPQHSSPPPAARSPRPGRSEGAGRRLERSALPANLQRAGARHCNRRALLHHGGVTKLAVGTCAPPVGSTGTGQGCQVHESNQTAAGSR